MLQNFKTYQLALELYQLAEESNVPLHLRDQLARAASSIVLNIAEGSGKNSPKDQARFYSIALGSLRECSAIFDLARVKTLQIYTVSDQLGACLYRLSHPR
jgi:four helix bundle protein